MSLYLAVTPMVLYICYVSQLDFALFGGVRASRLDPEEPFGADEREGLVERHDDRPEVAGRAPSVPAPPCDPDTVAIAGRPQPGHGSARAPAVKRVAAVRPHHFHLAARETVGRDAPAHRIGSAGQSWAPPAASVRSAESHGGGRVPSRCRFTEPSGWPTGYARSRPASPPRSGATCRSWSPAPCWRRDGAPSPPPC